MTVLTCTPRRVFLAAMALLAFASPARAAPDWDIVGLRLGMTPEQARAALLAHAPKAELHEHARQFTYDDGARQQALPGFLGSIVAEQGSGRQRETVEVMFSAPPMAQRVIRVVRTLGTGDAPVPLDRTMASVKEKYGEPQGGRDAFDGRGAVMRWVEAGRTVCGDTSATSLEAWQIPHVDNAPSGLGHYANWHRRKRAPADGSGCSAALVVQLVTRAPRDALVTEMRFSMSDPGYAVPAMQAVGRRIAELETRAVEARRGSSAVPKM